VLSDADKRAAYDRYGHAGLGGPGMGNPFSGSVDIGDIFGDLFGEMFSMGGSGQRGGARQHRGDDLRFDLAIDFEDAFFGTETEVKIRRLEVCGTCKGAAARPDAGLQFAPSARTRQLRYQQGFFSVARTCGACGGSGQVIGDPCTSCRGETRATKEISLHVKCRRVLKTERASAMQGKATPGARAAPRATCTLC